MTNAEPLEWAPFDANHKMGTAGTTVMLTTVGAPSPHITETKVTRADAMKFGGWQQLHAEYSKQFGEL